MIFLNSSLNNFLFLHQINTWLLISKVKRGIKSFRNIPGPVSLPGIGTLYQYLPFIGNLCNFKIQIGTKLLFFRKI